VRLNPLVRTTAVTLCLASALVACPGRKSPPPVQQGRVVAVDPIPSRPRAVFITVRYPDGFLGRYRADRAACQLDDYYPQCAEDHPN